MAMDTFVANGQAYFYYEGEDGKIYLKLGKYKGNFQQKDIAELKRAKEYAFGEKTVILKICGVEIPVSEMTDLEIFLKLQEFNGQILW